MYTLLKSVIVKYESVNKTFLLKTLSISKGEDKKVISLNRIYQTYLTECATVPRGRTAEH